MANETYISVIVPVYNGEKTIERCLCSLANQRYPKKRYEVIIVDNNSTDDTKKIIEKYPAKYLCEKKRGSYAARNKGIRYAKGRILAFTDADCMAHVNWIADAVREFSDKKTGCVAGRIGAGQRNSHIERYIAKKKLLIQKKEPCGLPLPYAKTANAFYRKEVFDKIGLFEEWISGGDADLCWRMQKKTEYGLKFSRALVIHKHRTSTAGLFKQCFKWGIGNAFLKKKYREMPQISFRGRLWIICRILFGLPMLFYLILKKDSSDRLFDRLAFIGWHLGMFIGFIKKR